MNKYLECRHFQTREKRLLFDSLSNGSTFLGHFVDLLQVSLLGSRRLRSLCAGRGGMSVSMGGLVERVCTSGGLLLKSNS